MASRDSLEIRKLLGTGLIEHRATDKPVAIRLTYRGTGTITSVTVTTGTGIVMITSDGGTDSYAFATYTNLGLLADAINADGIFDAKVLDGLRADLTTGNTLLDGAITAVRDRFNQITYPVYVDTSVALVQSVCLSPKPYFGMPDGHRVHLREFVYAINVGTAAADKVQIWTRNGTVETQVYSATSVDTTATTVNWASGEGYLSAQDGEDLIVLVKDAGSLADGGYIVATGLRE